MLCAAFGSGCAHLQTPRIDPTGQRIFAQPPIRTQPAFAAPASLAAPWEPVELTLSPATMVAPVGSEVVLVAGVVAGDNHFDMNRRLEWHLAQGSVGQFLAVSRGSLIDLLVGDFTRPRKIDSTYAIGSTSRRYQRIWRGTGSTADDVCTVPGQGWISLNSPVEGTSYVTVVAPEIADWTARTRAAVVHWIDAQFAYPPPSIHRAGTTHPLTTTVTRHSDGAPWEGWIVRYRVISGPPAGFAPDGAETVEVFTDASGRATAELMQTAPGPGTNIVSMEVFRPAGTGAPGLATGRLLVGSNSVTATWTAAALAVQKIGPATATVGATVTYQIVVSNPGDLPAQDVTVTDRAPELLQYLSSNPEAQLVGGQPQWHIGRLAPREQRVLEVHFRAGEQGTATNCVDATAAGPLSATGCATTTIGAEPAVDVSPNIDVRIEGPDQADVGEQARFHVLVTNRGQAPSGNLTLKSRFDEGLQHEVYDPQRVIEAALGDLTAGETHQVDIDFTVVKPGQWCHTIEVSSPVGLVATARACLTAAGVAPDEPPGEEPVGEATVSVRKTGPKQGTVGQLAEFTIDVTNTGSRELTNVRVVDRYDAALLPTQATEGYQLENGSLVWTFGRLQPGQTARIQILCNCLQATATACNRVSVTTSEGARGEDEACLEIRPPAAAPPQGEPEATLHLTVTDLRGMVGAGKELTYVIQVANRGILPDRQVVVAATIPDGMVPVKLGTTGPADPPEFDGQTVRFRPVPEIKPGQTLTYRVRVQTQRPGQFTFRAQATSERHDQPLVAEETTEVIN